MSEEDVLLEADRLKVRVALPSGLFFVGGLSSSYTAEVSGLSIDIHELVSMEDLEDVVSRFNESIQSFWPCTAVYACGCIMIPLTLGLSLFAPNYCISEAEKAGIRCLHQCSLKSCFYDRGMVFKLVKTWRCTSYIELSFPSDLLFNLAERGERNKQENLDNDGKNVVVTTAPGEAYKKKL